MDSRAFYNVINNELVSTSTARYSLNPANRQPNPAVPVSMQADLDRAVSAGRSAYKSWAKVSIEERRKALHAYSDALASNREFFINLLTQEQGKPITQAAGEVDLTITWLKEIPALDLPDTVIEENEERKIVQRYVPLGVAAGIVPWNFPVLLAVGKIAPAPSPFTPCCALKPGELACSIFPPGLIQVLSVVNIEEIVPKVATLSFLTSSQVCMMIKRLYVHEKIYDQFRDAFVKFTSSLKVGDGMEQDTFFGPVQNEMQYDKLKGLFSSITTEGLNPFLGGTINNDSKGFFITPTVIDNPPENSRVVQEEQFGPIIPLMKWSDEQDVLARANGTHAGLGASVWAAGSVWVNSHFDVSPKVPFGGHKWSGIGTK
ncbi:Aldehyde/histidinol dehydrogenase [Aspergillus leporis]|uniref:aldehyde dehydrogenase (NAD(+)) n=1 Tax=Aspergillus leporis TaxID=41062 RepID=A0A5N5WNI4_9EURO|nr:Aldehyde/histidinol dehydrogenase [Aspergillus leporis]